MRVAAVHGCDVAAREMRVSHSDGVRKLSMIRRRWAALLKGSRRKAFGCVSEGELLGRMRGRQGVDVGRMFDGDMIEEWDRISHFEKR